MNLSRWAQLTATLIVGTTAVGCDGSQDSGTTAPLLFEDPVTSGPRLDVFKLNGEIGVSVSGPIGTEGNAIRTLRPAATLTELYQNLHPAVSQVPSELVALDQTVAPLLKNIMSSPRPSDALPLSPVVDKSSSAFASTVCVTFGVSNTISFVPKLCEWALSKTLLPSNPALFTMPSGDRAYGWNNKNSPAQIIWSLPGSTSAAGSTNLPAFWWNWSSMLTGGPFNVSMTSASRGEMGLTHHAYTEVVR